MPERLPLLDNPRSDRIRGIVALGRRSVRRKRGELLVEGPQAVRELIRFRPQTVMDVYFSEPLIVSELFEQATESVRYTHVMTEQVSRAVGEQTQGVFAVCKEEAIAGDISMAGKEDGPIVILPETQDPGNAGTIIRAADAFGASGVIACSGTVDLASPKVIRASAGSVFHLPIIMGADFGAVIAEIDRPTFGAAGSGDPLNPSDLNTPHAWVFGNEARGLTQAQSTQCTKLISVPMSGLAESLNVSVAAGICLYTSQEAHGARR